MELTINQIEQNLLEGFDMLPILMKSDNRPDILYQQVKYPNK